jgi:parallel beta helix pectate lyase-like protein
VSRPSGCLLAITALAAATLAVASPAAAATLSVGPGKTYAKPCAAIAAAQPGDVVEVDASGDYAGNTCSWSTDGLTVTGVNGRAKIDLTGVAPSGKKGIFTIEGTASATIENFELSGAAISAADGNNAAGIRHQGLNLTVRNCFIHDNQDGILGGPATPNTGAVLIENSEFSANGAGDGFSHNMYIGDYAKFTLQYSYSHDANVGHLVKSRAYNTYVLYNRITDEPGGTASYETDIPNAGTAYVIGNVIEQSATTQNPTMLTFGEEGVPVGYDTHLFVVNNTFINTLGSGTFVNDAATTPAVLSNNVFYNGGLITNQSSAVRTTNFDSTMGDPMFVNLASYDVRLQPGSPCIDHGTDPGTGAGQPLAPAFEYVHPLSETARVVVGASIDVGAYEYGNPGGDGGAMSADDAGASADDGAAARGNDGGAVSEAGFTEVDSGDDAATTESGNDGFDGGTSGPGDSSPSKSGAGCGCVEARSVADAPISLVGAAMTVAGALARRSRTRRRSHPADS